MKKLRFNIYYFSLIALFLFNGWHCLSFYNSIIREHQEYDSDRWGDIIDIVEIAATTNEIPITLVSDQPSVEELMNPLDRVVKLLLPHDKANAYIARYPGSTLRFNIQQIPEYLQWNQIATDVEQFYLARERNISSIKELQNQYCDWGGTICNPKNSSHSQYIYY